MTRNEKQVERKERREMKERLVMCPIVNMHTCKHSSHVLEWWYGKKVATR
jgi:hypothetical protein